MTARIAGPEELCGWLGGEPYAETVILTEDGGLAADSAGSDTKATACGETERAAAAAAAATASALAAAASALSFLMALTALFLSVLWFCMAKVSAAVVMSGLLGLELLLLLPLLLLLSDSCRALATAVAAEAAGTALSPSFGLELSGIEVGRSMTRSGVCFCLCNCAAAGVGADVTATGVEEMEDEEDGCDVMEDLFSHKSRFRTNEPFWTGPEGVSIALDSDHPPTGTLTLSVPRSKFVMLLVSQRWRRNTGADDGVERVDSSTVCGCKDEVVTRFCWLLVFVSFVSVPEAPSPTGPVPNSTL